MGTTRFSNPQDLSSALAACRSGTTAQDLWVTKMRSSLGHCA